MRIFLLFSLIAIILSSCQKEDNKMGGDIDPQITELEKQYGIKFEKITGERDSSNTISMPFDELKQLLEESMNPKARSFITSPTTGRGRAYQDILKIKFKKVSFLRNHYFNLEIGILLDENKFDRYVSTDLFLKFGTTYVSLKTLLDINIATEYIYEPKINTFTPSRYGGWVFTGKVSLNINSAINGQWCTLKGTLNLSLDIARTIKSGSSFNAGLTLTFTPNRF